MGESLAAPQKGTLHTYDYNLTAFEFEARESKNAIVFIGGLGNQYLGVPYLSELNESVGPDWRLFQVAISSSGEGWGTGSLDRDVEEISKLVKYLKQSLKISKVVLFGHSTGCQDSLHYLLKSKEEVDAIILQASVSDREAIQEYFKESNFGKLEDFNKEAKEVYDTKGPLELLPKKFSDILFGAPINAYRWLSLAAVGGDDDYFSSDLPDDALKMTFGKINKPSLFLYSGSDSSVPKYVNKDELLKRWGSFTDRRFWNSVIIQGASHDIGSDSIDQEKATEILTSTVNKFLADI
jgi:pimeloyl-ACP methyl ester carboxylesterase